MKYSALKNFIGGEFVSYDGEFLDVQCPLDGSTISSVPISNAETINQAVLAAKKTFPIVGLRSAINILSKVVFPAPD